MTAVRARVRSIPFPAAPPPEVSHAVVAAHRPAPERPGPRRRAGPSRRSRPARRRRRGPAAGHPRAVPHRLRPRGRFDALAEPADGSSARAVSALAARHGIAVVHGYAERGADGRLHNSAVLTGPDGSPLGHYRKTHLYGDHEHRWFTPGDRPVVQARLDGLTLGLLVCYDVEFPETVRAHALA
ncbi:nitrilase-related carbon-nitrogen hydrolase [Actinomadura keratinilytica]